MSQKDSIYNPPKSFVASLSLVATNYAFRCDSKHADHDVIEVLNNIRSSDFFQLGEFLPVPFAKGIQPDYLDQPTDDSVPVISTLAIQNLAINEGDCRHILLDDFDVLTDERRLRINDVLLTVDGGVSIGKACLFNLKGEYTTDSHVVILRPNGIGALALVYLLASPLGQMQFRRAESGASGQTTVTEDDVRRFIFPKAILESIDAIARHIEKERQKIAKKRNQLILEEDALWQQLDKFSRR